MTPEFTKVQGFIARCGYCGDTVIIGKDDNHGPFGMRIAILEALQRAAKKNIIAHPECIPGGIDDEQP